jgi:hypothetical protein
VVQGVLEAMALRVSSGACGVHTCDANDILGRSGRAISSELRHLPRQRRA